MGGSSLPPAATKFGLSFLRLLKEEFPIFYGEGRANCYGTGFRQNGYDPDKGYGFILDTSDSYLGVSQSDG